MIKDILKKVNEDVLLNTMYNSIVITSGKLEGPEHPKILYANSAFERITGYKKDEVIGKTPRILQGEKTNRLVLERLKQTLKKGEFFEGSTTNYKKDGTEYFVEWNITPIFDEDGTLDCYFCVQKDITDLKKHEDYLENKIKEEIEKVKSKELIIQKQAKLASMGEMIDAIAHQWLNPLNNIKLCMEMTQYLLEDKNINDPEIKGYIERSLKNSSYLEETLKEFRGFFRQKDNVEDTSLKNIVENVLLLMKDELITNDIEVKYDICEQLKVKVIPNEFKHVLINLLFNSKDAFIENSIEKREVKLETIVENGNITLKVYDNAGGIPLSVIDKIFDQHITTKEEGGGTGIGLYMTKQILEKHHIEINVENINQGACFNIQF